ncbi:MAG: NIPSNAP family protein [Acidobacteriaceae bacterium]|nr:NIPSNAP family protein [Acidobacteriaceae bacterium]
MQRRRFLSSSLAASGAAVAGMDLLTAQPKSPAGGREYYQLRKYHFDMGAQQKLAPSYFEHALIPALNRLGITPVGVFELDIGPETPTTYLLMPSSSLDVLANIDLLLAQDQEFLKAGSNFWEAPAQTPAFGRVESSLMIAFQGHPKLTLPPATAQKGKRVFQMRTYESPSYADHIRKVEMFNSGEYDIFRKAGFWEVFYGDTLIGQRLPALTYMLSFADLAELNDKWKTFGSDPDWKKLSNSPRYSYEPIVSKITNLILNPADYSQI